MASTRREILPYREFLYTLDQVADLLSVATIDALVFYDRLQPGLPPSDKLRAVNIAPDGDRADWRIQERELLRWMRRKGFQVHQRTHLR